MAFGLSEKEAKVYLRKKCSTPGVAHFFVVPLQQLTQSLI